MLQQRQERNVRVGIRTWLAALGLATLVVVSTSAVGISVPGLSPLERQAVTLTVVTVALLVLGLATGGWQRLVAAERPTLLAVGLYGAAALQGTAVGLAERNSPYFVAGQALSMALLPIGAVAALGLLERGSWRPLATALVAAGGIVGAVQLATTLPTVLHSPPGARLFGGSTSFAGVAPLALFLAFALATEGGRRVRLLAWAVGVIAVAVILGSAIRSQWAVMPAGLATYAAVTAGRTRLLARRTIVSVAAAATVVASCAAVASWWWFKPRPALPLEVRHPFPIQAREPIVLTLPGGDPGAVRIQGTLLCRDTGCAGVLALPDQGPATDGSVCVVSVAGLVPSGFSMVVRPAPTERRIVLRLDASSHLGCTVSRLRAEELWPPSLAMAGGRLSALFYRPPDPALGASAGAFGQDASVAFRLREARALLRGLRRSSWIGRTFGHGLGATYSIDTLGYDSQGHIQRLKDPNYIHNFYLFLPWKLGLLGTAAVLSAFAIWVATAVGGARERPYGSADRKFFAAAAACWVTFIVWSAAAPEILDFRMAPIWGMLAAAVAIERGPAAPRPPGRSGTASQLARLGTCERSRDDPQLPGGEASESPTS